MSSQNRSGAIYKSLQPESVAIQGERGSYHFIVAEKLFGNMVDFHSFDSFREVFQSVNGGQSSLGVVGIENSISGSILTNYDLLTKHNLSIVGEIYLRVKLNLMALKGQTISSLSTIYSHSYSLAQAAEFLEQFPDIDNIAFSDTAGSAKMIRQRELISAGAIASRQAAELYDLEILARNIETDKQNYTRFVIISRKQLQKTNINKATFLFRAIDAPGSLLGVLKILKDMQINLTKIESRPIPGSKRWDYIFYVDVEHKNLFDKKAELMKKMQEKTRMLKVLGYYHTGEYVKE